MTSRSLHPAGRNLIVDNEWDEPWQPRPFAAREQVIAACFAATMCAFTFGWLCGIAWTLRAVWRAVA